MSKILFFIISLVFLIPDVFSQEKLLVKYNSEFSFKKGLYRTFNDFKNNKPQSIDTLSEASFFSQRWWGKSNGSWVAVSLWNQDLNLSDRYKTTTRLDIIGSICVFGSRKSQGVPYAGPGFIGSVNVITAKTYIVDFSTGKMFLFNRKKIEEIFKKDPDFYKEYKHSKLGKSKIFAFIKKYNDKHPISFPD